MNLRDVIITAYEINEDLVVYAKRVNEKLLPSSEVVLLSLTEEEHAMKVSEVEKSRCPGFSYCMEMFLIQDFLQDLDGHPEWMDLDRKIDRVIYYIEYDA